jgi:hypothetical protein
MAKDKVEQDTATAAVACRVELLRVLDVCLDQVQAARSMPEDEGWDDEDLASLEYMAEHFGELLLGTASAAVSRQYHVECGDDVGQALEAITAAREGRAVSEAGRAAVLRIAAG